MPPCCAISVYQPAIGQSWYAYNGLDARVSKYDSTGTRTYRRSGADPTSPVLYDGVAYYTPGISENWTGVGTRHFVTDYLGSTARTTSVQQNVLNTRTYDAYGNAETFTGTYAAPFGFAGAWGYQEDKDTGLKLLGHRYYDSSTGRFLTRDPIKDGRNWYAYAANNPTGAVDPTGLKPKGWGFVAKRRKREAMATLFVHGHGFGHVWIGLDYGTGDRRGQMILENVMNGNVIVGDAPANPTNFPDAVRTLPFDPERVQLPIDVTAALPEEYNLATNNCVHFGLAAWKRITGEDLTRGRHTPGRVQADIERLNVDDARRKRAKKEKFIAR